MVAARQVARFELHFHVGAGQFETLPCDEIDRQAGVFQDVRARQRAAADHALAAVIEQEGHLADAVEVFEPQLDVGDMVRLTGKSGTVLEEVGRRLQAAQFGDIDLVARLHADVGLGVSVVGNRDEALAVPPVAQRVEVLVPLDFDFRTVEFGLGRIGEAANHGVVVEARKHLDRVLDVLVEPGEAELAARAPVIFDAGFVIGQLAIDQPGVAGELAVAFRIVIGLQDQLAELGARDGLGRVETRLQAVGDFPSQRGCGQPIIVVQQRGIGRSAGQAVKPERHDLLRRVFVAHTRIERDPGKRFDPRLRIASLDLEPGGERRIGGGGIDNGVGERPDPAGSLRFRIVTQRDQRIAQQIVGAQRAERQRVIARRANVEFAAPRQAFGVGIGAAHRHAQPVGQLVTDIETAVIEVFGQVGERHRGATTLPSVLQVEIDIVEPARGIEVARIDEFPFVRRFALRLGITAAQVDRQVAEFEFADKLRVEQLAFVPAGVLEQIVIVVGQVGNLCQRRALERIADVEVRQAEAVLAHFEPETEHGIGEDPLVGLELVARLVEVEIAVQRGLPRDEAIAVLVAERGSGDHAEPAIGEDIDAGARGDAARPVDGQFVGALQEDQIGIAQFGQDGLLVHAGVVERLPAVEEGLQVGAGVAAPIVEAEPVVIGPVIGVARAEGRFGVA